MYGTLALPGTSSSAQAKGTSSSASPAPAASATLRPSAAPIAITGHSRAKRIATNRSGAIRPSRRRWS